ncbi:MAG: cation:proton antiporter domain-containing protein [Chromatiales bacterium]
MPESSVAHSIFVIFVGAAALATAALYARQAMIVAYILVGMALGPSGLGLVSDAAWIEDVADIGVMFLLYLLGLNLAPVQLGRMFREALWVTMASSALFAVLGFLTALLFRWSVREAMVAGVVLMFSSTIIGLKLLPTTTLHHQRMGQVVISVLLLQDLIAIVFMLLFQGYGEGREPLLDVVTQLGSLVLLGTVAVLLQRYVVERLIARFDQIREYLFLLVIAWCLGIAEFARYLGLSHEIGAFVAGVALASSPVALFITESLKPLRDFFLILFFFSLGASFDMSSLLDTAWAAVAMALVSLALKPLVFRGLLTYAGEKSGISLEIGVRLGQISEFSLLVAVAAAESGFIGEDAADGIKMATLVTFIVSSCWVVLRYPTPIAVSDRLRRD